MRLTHACLLAAGAVLLAGCASEPTGSPSSAAPSPTTTRTPTPTASSASPHESESSATPEPPSASPSASPSTKPGTTYLTFRLDGQAACAGGRLGAHNTTVTPLWEKFTPIPKSGALTVAVPTKYTKHMAFDIQCRAWPNTGGVPVVALQYADVAPGASPPTDSAGRPTATFGSFCWAGTRDPQSEFTVRAWIDKGDGTPLSGAIALFADPTVATVPEVRSGQRWQEAPDGQLGHQDEPYC